MTDLSRQAGRFLISGGTAVTVDFLSFLALRHLDVPLIPANTVAFSLAFLTGFTINRYWTFEAASGKAGRQLLRYGAVAVTGLILNTTVLAALIAVGTHEMLAKSVATIASAALNFILSRQWVFEASRA